MNNILYGVTAIQLQDGWHAISNLSVFNASANHLWFTATENLGSEEEPNLFTLAGPLESIIAVRKKQ